MKKLKDYVCTFRQAKRFKEFCVNQDSLFYYNGVGKLLKQPTRFPGDRFSAYTLHEIYEIIRTYPGAVGYINARTCVEAHNLVSVAYEFIRYLEKKVFEARINDN